MKQISAFLFCIFMLVFLTACSSQAKEGNFYIATTNDTKIVTVVDMSRIEACKVEENTIAYASRETYFDTSLGSAGYEETLLTEVFHNGRGCSDQTATYDFIEENPKDAGWKEVKENSSEWELALSKLCVSDRTKPLSLEALCEESKKNK